MAPVCGENLVRIAFLDESGRSQREPQLVVAGISLHRDRSYRKIEEALRQLVTDVIPYGDQGGFVFHATDLFQGSRYFNRERWPRERRFQILERLAGLPKLFALPVVFGNVVKTQHRREPEIARHIEAQPEKDKLTDLLVIEHMTAFSRAVINIERQMWRFPTDEICMLIAEDTDLVKPAVKAS
jgi:hypothetical protein